MGKKIKNHPEYISESLRAFGEVGGGVGKGKPGAGPSAVMFFVV